MPLHIEMFPEEFIALNAEIQNHPALATILSLQPNQDFHVRVAEIAAYLGIALDDTYSGEDIVKLCGIMCTQLMVKRTIILN
jgi:hypothetical protein